MSWRCAGETRARRIDRRCRDPVPSGMASLELTRRAEPEIQHSAEAGAAGDTATPAVVVRRHSFVALIAMMSWMVVASHPKRRRHGSSVLAEVEIQGSAEA